MTRPLRHQHRRQRQPVQLQLVEAYASRSHGRHGRRSRHRRRRRYGRRGPWRYGRVDGRSRRNGHRRRRSPGDGGSRRRSAHRRHVGIRREHGSGGLVRRRVDERHCGRERRRRIIERFRRDLARRRSRGEFVRRRHTVDPRRPERLRLRGAGTPRRAVARGAGRAGARRLAAPSSTKASRPRRRRSFVTREELDSRGLPTRVRDRPGERR